MLPQSLRNAGIAGAAIGIALSYNTGLDVFKTPRRMAKAARLKAAGVLDAPCVKAHLIRVEAHRRNNSRDEDDRNKFLKGLEQPYRSVIPIFTLNSSWSYGTFRALKDMRTSDADTYREWMDADTNFSHFENPVAYRTAATIVCAGLGGFGGIVAGLGGLESVIGRDMHLSMFRSAVVGGVTANVAFNCVLGLCVLCWKATGLRSVYEVEFVDAFLEV